MTSSTKFLYDLMQLMCKHHVVVWSEPPGNNVFIGFHNAGDKCEVINLQQLDVEILDKLIDERIIKDI